MSENPKIKKAIAMGFQYMCMSDAFLEDLSPAYIAMLPHEVAIRNRAIVIALNENIGQLTVVIDNHENAEKMEILQSFLGKFSIVFFTTTPEEMDYALQKLYTDYMVAQ